MKSLIIARKEINSLLREKTLILTVLIQFFIASFSAFLVVGIMSYITPEVLDSFSTTKVDIAFISDTPSNRLLTELQSSGKFNIKYSKDYNDGVSQFFSGEVDGIVVLTEGLNSRTDPYKLDIYLPKTDIKATLIATYLKEPLEAYESYLRDDRIDYLSPDIQQIMLYDLDIPKTRTKSSFFEFIYGILIPLIVLAPALVSGGLIIDLLTEELEKKTIDLLIASPIELLEIIKGKLIVSIGIAPIQAYLWIFLLSKNRIFMENIGAIIFFVFIVTLILTFISTILVLKFKNRGVSHFLYSLIIINLFLLAYTLPQIGSTISKIFPIFSDYFISILSQLSAIAIITQLALGGNYIGNIMFIIPYIIISIILYWWIKNETASFIKQR